MILDLWNYILYFANLQDLIKLKQTCSKLNGLITKTASPMIVLSKVKFPKPGDDIIKNTIIIKEHDVVSNITSIIRSSFIKCKFSIVYARGFTNNDLKYIPLTHLDLSYHIINYNDKIVKKINKVYLLMACDFEHNEITDIGLGYLNDANLTSLNLSGNKTITNNGIISFTNLKCINLSNNSIITINGIQPSVNTLTTLNLSKNKNFTDNKLKLFVNLTSINLSNNDIITINGIIHLRLIQLDLCRNIIFSEMDVNKLIYLQRLNLCMNTKINSDNINISCLIKTINNFHVW